VAYENVFLRDNNDMICYLIENDLDQMNPEDPEMENMEDDEARAFHFRGLFLICVITRLLLILYLSLNILFFHVDSQYDYAVDLDITFKYSDQYDTLYKDLPKKHHTLKKAKICEFCNAKRFPGEGPAFCCKKGKVNVYIPELPAGLRRLFMSQTDKNAKYFQKHIRYFNSHFSFTSFGVSTDHHLASARGTGVYYFKAHGHIYHRLDQLVPGGRGPCHISYTFMTLVR
jgi:hypothetical protein